MKEYSSVISAKEQLITLLLYQLGDLDLTKKL